MFVDEVEWAGRRAAAMARHVALRRRIDELEAEDAQVLAEVVDAYTWPDDLPVTDRMDQYRPETIDGRRYGEDLSAELAVAGQMSETAARHLVYQVVTLRGTLPACWTKVIGGQAKLWQAGKIADACDGLDAEQCATVDKMVSRRLGAVGYRPLTRTLHAAVTLADPQGARKIAKLAAPRFVRTSGDPEDPMVGWLDARLDRPGLLDLAATIRYLATRLAQGGDTDVPTDELQARALLLLANPAAAAQFMELDAGVPGPTPAGADATVYVHVCADTIDDPDAIARVEGYGPLLLDQIAALTQAATVKLTPVIHLGADTISIDAYEIPDRIREHVILTDPTDRFPWSNIESRHLDLDHVKPYRPGKPGQTTPGNLAPLSRHAHRAKTHAGWRFEQPRPGTYLWITPAGQRIQVDHTGSHTLPLRDHANHSAAARRRQGRP
jgi:hypothetical protein